MKLSYSLKLLGFLNLIVLQCLSQDSNVQGVYPMHDFEFTVGYPVINTIGVRKHSNFYSPQKRPYINSKSQAIDFNLFYSHSWKRNLRYEIGLSYFKNEFNGFVFKYYYNTSNPDVDRRTYNIYQIFRYQELRLNLLLTFDKSFQNKTYIRTSFGIGFHVFPYVKGKREFNVSSYYTENQDTSIQYFRQLAVNKKAYRSESILSPGILIKSDYHFLSKKRFDIFTGLNFKFNTLPTDDSNSGSHIFEDTMTANKYEVAYALNFQLFFSVHLGVTFKGKKFIGS